MTLEQLFAELHSELIPYYRSWTHDAPMVVSRARDNELRRMSSLLYRACLHYVKCYRDYLGLISYDDKILELLEYAERYPYRAGTWRPDYLILENGGLKFCEITSRFFANGYFLSYFMECTGEAFAREAGITDRLSYFEEMLAYFADMPQGRRRLSVIKSADKSDSIKLYVPFYRALGMQPLIFEADEVEKNLRGMEGSMVVSALNQQYLLSYSMQTLKTLCDYRMTNDFRTIFLLHDKRFFRLIFEDSFTCAVFDEEETAFLREHVVETYLWGEEEAWEKARKDKDGFIVKHHCLGKSEKVYAGCLTRPDEWEQLFATGQTRHMILQPFMRQRICTTSWQGQLLDDYVAGTVLTIDDRYFGTGLFRTSTRPVINQTDAHKIAQLVTDEAERLDRYYVL